MPYKVNERRKNRKFNLKSRVELSFDYDVNEYHLYLRYHTSFEYVFLAEQTGTFWYHSHNGIQRLDGLFGALTIYEKGKQAMFFYFLINYFR